MATTKTVKTEAENVKTVKTAPVKAAAAKTEAVKTEEVKTEAAKAETVKAEAAKTVEKTVKAAKTAVKKAAAKKPAAKKTAGKAVITTNIVMQYQDKSYTNDDLLKIAKDVWKFDLKKKAGDMSSVELYVKPEESKVYYVFNGVITGSFPI